MADRSVNIAYGAGRFWICSTDWKVLVSPQPLGARGFGDAQREAEAAGYSVNATGQTWGLLEQMWSALDS